MAGTDMYGLPIGDINYGMGSGWLPYYAQAQQNAADMYKTSAGLGDNLLNTLFGLARDPAAGPLGLAAYGAFGGGAQNAAAATGGKGIPNPYGGLLDRLLTGLSQSVMNPQSPFNPDNGGQFNFDANKIDPNKAPAMTPENAAKAPTDGLNDWQKAWQAFNPGKTLGQDKGIDYHAAMGGVIPTIGDHLIHALFGFPMVPLASRGYTGDPINPTTTPIETMPTTVAAPTSIVKGDSRWLPHDPIRPGPGPMPFPLPTPIPVGGTIGDPVSRNPGDWVRNAMARAGSGYRGLGHSTGHIADEQTRNTVASALRNSGLGHMGHFEDGGLQVLAQAGLNTPEKVAMALANKDNPMAQAINQYGQSDLSRKAMLLASGGLEGRRGDDGNWVVGDSGSAFGPYQMHLDTKGVSEADANDPYKSTERMSNDYNLAAERVMREQPQLFASDPAQAAALTAYYAERPAQMYDKNTVMGIWNSLFPQPQMATGGGMTIGGEPHFIVDAQGNKVAALTEDGKAERVDGIGGVEVTPLDPARKAAYEARKRSGTTVASMGESMLKTGGSSLFPTIPDSGHNTDPNGNGTDMLPTAGGPTGDRGSQVGEYFHSVYDPSKGTFSLPTEATDATTSNDPMGYAKLLGGALSAGNTAVPLEFLSALNSGKAPAQLLSANALSTLAPSQRTSYFALLQSMGLGSPEDNTDMIQKGRPDTMI